MPARNRHLPRGLSWPLTPADIRAVLGVEETGGYTVDFYDHPLSGGILLQATWNPPRFSNYGYAGRPSPRRIVAVGVAPLPAIGRADARLALRQDALPELAAWIDSVQHAPETWILTGRRRFWRLAGNSTVRRDDRQPYP
ncbi:hypothetical protein ACFV0O_36615 [Kitasatospora sp. NPDC059577]|uniref:hypothetical protein n=1 Tax=unclassified Kitasatospora TaxID=2633591 RepID=UPI00369E9F09